MDINKLQVLRSCTTLNPNQKIKVIQAFKQADNYSKLYNSMNPNKQIDADYSVAYELGYSYRYINLQKKITRDWQKYGEGVDIEEFTDKVINSQLQNRKRK